MTVSGCFKMRNMVESEDHCWVANSVGPGRTNTYGAYLVVGKFFVVLDVGDDGLIGLATAVGF